MPDPASMPDDAMLGPPIPNDVLRRLNAPPFVGKVVDGTAYVTTSLLARELLALRAWVRKVLSAEVPGNERNVPALSDDCIRDEGRSLLPEART